MRGGGVGGLACGSARGAAGGGEGAEEGGGRAAFLGEGFIAVDDGVEQVDAAAPGGLGLVVAEGGDVGGDLGVVEPLGEGVDGDVGRRGPGEEVLFEVAEELGEEARLLLVQGFQGAGGGGLGGIDGWVLIGCDHAGSVPRGAGCARVVIGFWVG